MLEISVNILIAVLTAITSIFLVSKKYKKDLSLETSRKRYELYMEIYELIDESIKDPEIVFENSYLKKLESYNPRMKLIASDKVNYEFTEFKIAVSNKIQEFKTFCYDNDPLKGLVDEEHYNIDPQEIYDYNNDKHNFISENAPESKQIQSFINGLEVEMRVDIGTFYKPNGIWGRIKKILKI